MIEFFLFYFFQSLVFLAITYLIGGLALATIKNSIYGYYTKLFFQFLIGIIILVTTIAIIKTQFKTILLGVCIVFILLLLTKIITLHKPKILDIKSNFNLLRFFKVVICCFIIYLGTFIFIFDFKNGFAFSPHGDTTFYAYLSESIFQSGAETQNIDTLQLLMPATSLYHYFDSWMNASFNLFITNKPVLNILLNTYTIAYLLLCIGFCGIIEHFKPIKVIHIILASFLPMSSVFYVPALLPKIRFFSYLDTFEVNPIQYAKVFIVYWCILACCLLLQRHKTKLAIYSLGILPIFYTTTSPVIFCFFGIEIGRAHV